MHNFHIHVKELRITYQKLVYGIGKMCAIGRKKVSLIASQCLTNNMLLVVINETIWTSDAFENNINLKWSFSVEF